MRKSEPATVRYGDHSRRCCCRAVRLVIPAIKTYTVTHSVEFLTLGHRATTATPDAIPSTGSAPWTSLRESPTDVKSAAAANANATGRDVKFFRTQCWQKRDTILFLPPRVFRSSVCVHTGMQVMLFLFRNAYGNSLRLDTRSAKDLIATPLLSRHRALLRSLVVIGSRDELHEASLGASSLNGTCFVEFTNSIETLRTSLALCSSAIIDNKILTHDISGLVTHDSCPFSHKTRLEVERGE